MELGLEGKTAYVTGGAEEIGRATVVALAQEGVRVAVSDLDSEGLADIERELGPAVITIEADLATVHGARAAAEHVLAKFGGAPNCLVNNVGGSASQGFDELSDAGWMRSFELNFVSHVRTTKVIAGAMAANGPYAIVNMASDLAKQPETVPADYGCMKSALLHLTKILALQMAPRTRVNAVLPGPTWTGLWHKPGGVIPSLAAARGTDEEEALNHYLKDRQLAMGMGQPEEVANAILFLLSPLAARVNGAALDIGGTQRGLF